NKLIFICFSSWKLKKPLLPPRLKTLPSAPGGKNYRIYISSAIPAQAGMACLLGLDTGLPPTPRLRRTGRRYDGLLGAAECAERDSVLRDCKTGFLFLAFYVSSFQRRLESITTASGI